MRFFSFSLFLRTLGVHCIYSLVFYMYFETGIFEGKHTHGHGFSLCLHFIRYSPSNISLTTIASSRNKKCLTIVMNLPHIWIDNGRILISTNIHICCVNPAKYTHTDTHTKTQHGLIECFVYFQLFN